MSAPEQDVLKRLEQYSGRGDLPPAEALDLLRAGLDRCPVIHSRELGGFHMILRNADVRAAHSDSVTYVNRDGITRPVDERPKLGPAEYDDPEHELWRTGVYNKAINLAAARRVEPQIREDVIRLIEELRTRDSFDVVEDLAQQVALATICRIMGFELELGPEMGRLVHDLHKHFADEGYHDALQALADFGVAEVNRRRADPRDDILTQLVDAEYDGRPLTELQIGEVVATVVVTGLDTTRAALTSLIYEVYRRPEIKQRLTEDTSLVPAAIEENLRLHPAFFGLYRTIDQAARVAGAELPAGDHALLCTATANYDPEVYDEPGEFRLDRRRNRHLTFGIGKHACIGAPVARMELRIVLEEILVRMPDLTFENADDVPYVFGPAEDVRILELRARA